MAPRMTASLVTSLDGWCKRDPAGGGDGGGGGGSIVVVITVVVVIG